MAKRVEIYGRDDCRFCAAAVAHCQRKGYAHVYYNVGRDQALMAALVDRLGREPKTVPQIFIGGHHIGGFTDLQANDVVVQQILGGN